MPFVLPNDLLFISRFLCNISRLSEDIKIKDTQLYSFACCFMWVRNSASRSNRITLAEDVREQGAEGNIWAWEGRKERRRRKLHSRGLQALYCSPDIVRLIKSRRMRWARHVADMGDKINNTCVLVGNLRESYNLKI